MRYLMLLSAGALVTGLATGQDRHTDAQRATDTERAIAAIRKLGGQVTASSKKPGAPVKVVLTGSTSPADCLPHLKEVSNLHTCDL